MLASTLPNRKVRLMMMLLLLAVDRPNHPRLPPPACSAPYHPQSNSMLTPAVLFKSTNTDGISLGVGVGPPRVQLLEEEGELRRSDVSGSLAHGQVSGMCLLSSVLPFIHPSTHPSIHVNMHVAA